MRPLKSVFLTLLSFNLFSLGTVLAATTGSEALSTHPTVYSKPTSAMTFSNVSTVIRVRTNWTSVFVCGSNTCLYAPMPRCPTGSTYINPPSEFTSTQISNCFYNEGPTPTCPPGMARGGPDPYFGRPTLYFELTCALDLQGWFATSLIENILGSNKAIVANNFRWGQFEVTFTCGNSFPCGCSSQSPIFPQMGNHEVPSYGDLCVKTVPIQVTFPKKAPW